MVWLWIGLGLILVLALLVVIFHFWVKRTYIALIARIFQEKPLFIIPRGQPVDDAEDVQFRTPDGLTLRGCYLRAEGPRQGVILFGLEFGSNRWSCLPYCEFLRGQGFDIFTFECRNQGDSDRLAGYEPLQWVTAYEVVDFQAALTYLKSRADADPRGIGFFGLSKGGGAGLLAAASDTYVRCFVTDGIFATHTTMVGYMRQWVRIYSNKYRIQKIVPTWYYAWIARRGLDRICQERQCTYPHLEEAMGRLGARPLLMIHGGDDTYIKPEMAQILFGRIQGPKEFWLVGGAKHNQAINLANGEYQERILKFFQVHLGAVKEPTFENQSVVR